ncbi:hypothetical protein CRE_21306 [Caenorhabditis remanei]|uniref:C2H2-type domain-containing protein n=1 Tax=Caenorhabditis remanei TaxID=31234 RepID=E3MUL4_CAERE|nr:hypothetical protein CRE_21306 [Caenorhabditis remanei]
MINNYYTTCPNMNQNFYHPLWYQGTDHYVPSYFTNTSYSYPLSPHVSNSPDNLVHQVPASSIPQYQVTHQPLRCLWNTDRQQCQKVFSNSENLGFHVREEHAEGRKICQWDNCGKEFKQKYRLVNHLPVHTGEKAFQCDTCAKLFARAENLKIHKRTHTGEKPFACTHFGCDKRFGSSTDRRKHMYCHAEKKKYVCEHSGCGKRYTHPSSLRAHRRNYHKDQIFKFRPLPTPIENTYSVLSSYRSPEMNEDTTQADTRSMTPGNCFKEFQNDPFSESYINNYQLCYN